MKKIKSGRLKSGDYVGIVAPASPVADIGHIEQAAEKVSNIGFKPIIGKTVKTANHYLAGTDLERVTDFEELWANPSVKAIWCLRGGYGSIRLLSSLCYRLIASHPKILVGFSDITALELGFWAQMHLVTFHGPVLTTFNGSYSQNFARQILSEGLIDKPLPWPEGSKARFRPLKAGKARGFLIGGNLNTIVSLLGTHYLPCFDGAVLFLEEVNEAVYRIDRMLTQLILSNVLESVAGVMIGRCLPVDGETEVDIIEVFRERLSGLSCPIAYGYPIGHIEEQWTLPQGIEVELDAENGELELVEACFVDLS